MVEGGGAGWRWRGRGRRRGLAEAQMSETGGSRRCGIKGCLNYVSAPGMFCAPCRARLSPNLGYHLATPETPRNICRLGAPCRARARQRVGR